MGAIAQEKESGTAVLMPVKSLPRGVFLPSEFPSLGLAFLIRLAQAAVGSYDYTIGRSYDS